MVAQQQLKVELACGAYFGGIGFYLHTLGCGHNAGSRQRAGVFDLHKAHPAGADLVYILKIAQCGNVYIGLPGSLQHGGTGRNLHLDAVYGQIYRIHYNILLVGHFFWIAPKRHLSMQAPHLMHLD